MPASSSNESVRYAIPEPYERYYLFSLALPRRFEICGEIVHYNGYTPKALMNADFAFIRQSDEHVSYVEFQVIKNRAGIPFHMTKEFYWLQEQYTSITYYPGILKSGPKSGVIRVSDGRDLLLIKMFHSPEICENRTP